MMKMLKEQNELIHTLTRKFKNQSEEHWTSYNI